jgi:hypothetical protein
MLIVGAKLVANGWEVTPLECDLMYTLDASVVTGQSLGCLFNGR